VRFAFHSVKSFPRLFSLLYSLLFCSLLQSASQSTYWRLSSLLPILLFSFVFTDTDVLNIETKQLVRVPIPLSAFSLFRDVFKSHRSIFLLQFSAKLKYGILEGEMLLGAIRQELNSCLCMSYFEVPKSSLCLYLSDGYTWIIVALSCPCV
jgi:hypothetical protein